MLFHDLQVPLHTAPIVCCDNVGAIALASNPIFHTRIKHIKVDYHFIQEKILNKYISLQYIPSIEQTLDVFTKGLSTSQFLFLRDKFILRHHFMHLRVDVNHYAIITQDQRKKSSTTQGQIAAEISNNIFKEEMILPSNFSLICFIIIFIYNFFLIFYNFISTL